MRAQLANRLPAAARALLDYLLPATFFFTVCSIGYGLLALSGVADPIERWWWELGGLGLLLDVGSYVVFICVFAWVGYRKNWRLNLRWVLQMNSRRGMRIAGVPAIDLLLLLMLFLTPLLLARYGPIWLALQTLYLIVPLAFALTVALLRTRPDPLDDVVSEDSIDLEQFAKDKKLNLADLRKENGLEENANRSYSFGQTIKLPASAAGRKPGSG